MSGIDKYITMWVNISHCIITVLEIYVRQKRDWTSR